MVKDHELRFREKTRPSHPCAMRAFPSSNSHSHVKRASLVAVFGKDANLRIFTVAASFWQREHTMVWSSLFFLPAYGESLGIWKRDPPVAAAEAGGLAAAAGRAARAACAVVVGRRSAARDLLMDKCCCTRTSSSCMASALTVSGISRSEWRDQNSSAVGEQQPGRVRCKAEAHCHAGHPGFVVQEQGGARVHGFGSTLHPKHHHHRVHKVRSLRLNSSRLCRLAVF